jgi:hypothetical protein
MQGMDNVEFVGAHAQPHHIPDFNSLGAPICPKATHTLHCKEGAALELGRGSSVHVLCIPEHEPLILWRGME